MMNAAIQWFPLLTPLYYAALILLAALIVWAAWRRKLPDLYFRALFLLLLAVILLNPVLQHEMREALPDKVVIVMDDSASQKIGGRDKTAAAALQHIETQIKKIAGMEPVVIRATSDPANPRGENTALFTALRDRLTDIPASQVAGTILITDGQVHDVPANLGPLSRLTPFHVILTGKKDEFDRKVTIVSAPKYSVLNSDIRIAVKVEEFGRPTNAPVVLTSYQDGVIHLEQTVASGETVEIPFKLAHPGQNVFEFKVAPVAGELTAHNNTAPVIVNGIRDRLRVLLVSGAPHMGERAWRNLLKSDPAIDLVHFTILRSPSAIDATPQKELSLIVFPVDELFEKKLNDFDLIIFDRYQQYGLLVPEYFDNIVRFVKNGGALLMEMGTDRQDTFLQHIPLGGIVPAVPAGADILKQSFKPALTEKGREHPVTSELASLYNGANGKSWGNWFSQADLRATGGELLMTGAQGKPLLILDKVEKGRVAVLASDNIWLWSKNMQGSGGPYTDFLRNIAHWLMKEPELEENFFKAEARGNVVTLSLRDTSDDEIAATMTAPSGAEQTIALGPKEGGWRHATVTAEENGVYSFVARDRKAFAVVGTASSEEFSDVHTTGDKLAPIVKAAGGQIVWFEEHPSLDLRGISPDARSAQGADWFGLKQNKVFAVQSVESRAVVPDSWALLLLLMALMAVWWREGGKKSN